MMVWKKLKMWWHSHSIVRKNCIAGLIAFLKTHKIGLVLIVVIFFLTNTESGRWLCFDLLMNLVPLILVVIFLLKSDFVKIVAYSIVDNFTLQLLIEYLNSDVFFAFSFVLLVLMSIHLYLKRKKI